jgi:hypothetical protein
MEGSEGQVVGLIVMLFVALVGLVLLVLAVISYIWMYNDAEKRGKPGCLVVLVMLFFAAWPLNLIVWLVCRPPLVGGPPAQPQYPPQPQTPPPAPQNGLQDTRPQP